MSQVFIISAPSGSGKSTLVRSLLEHEPGLIFSVSYTTRAPRGQEQEGREYHFVSREEFERMIAAGQFIEWARVFDHYYGTHRRYVDQGAAEGRDVLLDIDVQGARQLKEKIPGAVSIFILAPSREELEKRLRARGDTGDDVIRRRLAEAAREMRNFEQYDYVLVNDDLQAAAERLLWIVRTSRLRSSDPKVKARVREILQTFEQ
ncbi:MAG: guanylate kinase [Bryobacteraceae bacterium]|nr:MAG: guanylate kinase [Bryobacteraceae bacterium]